MYYTVMKASKKTKPLPVFASTLMWTTTCEFRSDLIRRTPIVTMFKDHFTNPVSSLVVRYLNWIGAASVIEGMEVMLLGNKGVADAALCGSSTRCHAPEMRISN